jgi:hypothetical protein
MIRVGSVSATSPQNDLLVKLWCAQDALVILHRRARLVVELSQLHAEIEAEMARLCEVIPADNSLGLRLTLQRRSTGAVALRWNTLRQRAVSNEELARRVAGIPHEASRWYAALAIQVDWLNAKERLVRHARQVMRDLTEERSFHSLIGGSIHE